MALLNEEIFVWSLQIVGYLLLTVLFGLGFTKYRTRNRKISLIDQIPGPIAYPIIGNIVDFIAEPREFFLRCMGYVYIWNFHSPVVRFWGANAPLVCLYKPETVEMILSSNKHIYKSRHYLYMRPWLGTGLLTSTGSKWFTRRKLLTPAFHFKILEDFVDVFNNQSNKMVSKLQKNADGNPFDIFPYVTLCTLDIIFETAMGCCINAQDNKDSDYVKAVSRMSALIQQRQCRPWLHPDFLYRLWGNAKEHDACIKILHDTAYKAIADRRKDFQNDKKDTNVVEQTDDDIIGKKKRLAFLDLLLEYAEGENPLTDEDIREEVDTFMFEGHDTTAAAINWSLYLMGCNPKIQERVYEELFEVFGTTDQPATMSDLRQLKYTENCIKEALRLFPSVPMMARELQEEVVIDKYLVPAGVSMAILPYRLHRDPEHFPNPEVYDPDRFLPENCITRHPYAYIPFSAGPRNCIGQKFALMEEKIVVSNVLRKFRVESTVRREDLRILGELILRPEDGNVLKLFPRV